MNRQMRITSHLATFSLAAMLTGCGGGGAIPPPPPPPIISVEISPSTATLPPGGTQSFGLSVTGNSQAAVNAGVSWSVREGVAGGSVTNAGLYSAPQTAGTFHVVATSVADPSKSGSATITVTAPPVTVRVSPASETLGFRGQRDFDASVSGANNTSVTWSVQEGAAGGSVTSDGVYTAPSTLGTFHVVATSVANASASATATITVVQSGFVLTGQMASPRHGHTATLLSDGRVLVTGGFDIDTNNLSPAISPLSSAEIFDPATGNFSSTGSMQHPRAYHTATLLSGGKVLVAGGADSASAELFDPASGTFTAAGSMTTGRLEHTATLLADGSVLLAGGFDSRSTRNALSTAEIFDPATGSFAPTGSMQTARQFHTAALLPGGKVLVAGGFVDTSGGAVASAELYGPATRSFSATGSMISPRGEFTATPLPGPAGLVLVLGGIHFFFDGAVSNVVLFTTAEAYDPGAGAFISAGRMLEARYLHTAIVLADGTLLVAGGDRSFFSTGIFAELFDPASGSSRLTGSLAVDRWSHTATVLADGRVLVIGGQGAGRVVLASAELYSP